MKIAVIIPVYNERKAIHQVLKKIPSCVKFIISVDDASTDDTRKYISEFKSSSMCDSRYHFLSLKENKGVGGATVYGFYYAIKLGANILVKMDGDGQMLPDYLPSLIKPILEGKSDLMKGNRLYSFSSMKNMPKIRLFGNLLLSILTAIPMKSLQGIDPQNGYIAISASFFKKLNTSSLNSRFAFENSLLIEANRKKGIIGNLPIPSFYGNESSHISISKFIIDFCLFLLRELV